MSDGVRVERDHRVLIITIDRPAARNAIDGAAAFAIADALTLLDADPGITIGILTGAGGTFSAGMDLKAFLSGERPEVPGRGLAGLTRTPPAKPLIAAVEGYALAGGFELVLACDLVVAADNASFGLPEVKRGLIAGSGGLLQLPRRMPPAIAMQYALTGEVMSAAEAHRWGLVNELTAPGEALPAALKLAAAIAAHSPLAVRTTKRLVQGGSIWSREQGWIEQDTDLAVIVNSPDAREGASAFLEKRPPEWHSS